MVYELELLKSISKALRQVNGRKLRRREKKLEKQTSSALQVQKKYVLRKVKSLLKEDGKALDRKSLEDDIEKLLDGINNSQLEELILASSGSAMLFGAKYRIKKEKLGRFGITFDLNNDLASVYLKTDRPLILAKMKETTKDALRPILVRAVETGESYQETAKLISEAGAFAKSRAQMIATNEIGHAYEWGNRVPMVDLQEKGFKVTKKWSTVNDNLVTPECADNEGDGWIALDKGFSSGDDSAPRADHPRCRCTTLYDFKE